MVSAVEAAAVVSSSEDGGLTVRKAVVSTGGDGLGGGRCQGIGGWDGHRLARSIRLLYRSSPSSMSLMTHSRIDRGNGFMATNIER